MIQGSVVKRMKEKVNNSFTVPSQNPWRKNQQIACINKLHMYDDDIKYIVMTDVLIRRIGYLRMEGIWGEAAPNELIPITLVSLWEVLSGLWKGPAKTNQLFHSGCYWAKTPLILLSNQQRRCPLKKNGVLPWPAFTQLCCYEQNMTMLENRWPRVATTCQCIQGAFHTEFSSKSTKAKTRRGRYVIQTVGAMLHIPQMVPLLYKWIMKNQGIHLKYVHTMHWTGNHRLFYNVNIMTHIMMCI